MAKKKVKKTTKKATAKKVVKKKKTAKAAKKSVTKKKAVKKISSKAKTAKASKKKKVTQKKASKKKTTPKRTLRKKVRKKRTSTLTASELQRYRQLLIERLKEILGSVSHIESGALKTSRQDSAGDLSSMPIHMADIGSDNYEQEFALGLMDSERKIVQEIYEALSRIENGTYGICEGTGEPIPKKRLDGIPWTRYCVKYAEMVEKGLVFVEEPSHEDEFEYVIDEDEEELDVDDDREMFFYGYDDDEDEEEEELP